MNHVSSHESRITITSHLHHIATSDTEHASGQESKTKVFVTLRKKMKYCSLFNFTFLNICTQLPPLAQKQPTEFNIVFDVHRLILCSLSSDKLVACTHSTVMSDVRLIFISVCR